MKLLAQIFLVRRKRWMHHTWERAHSRTVTMRSCSGWKHIPTLPMGCGSVTDVGKLPSQSNRPYKPFHWLCRSAVFGKHQGIKSTSWPDDSFTCHPQTHKQLSGSERITAWMWKLFPAGRGGLPTKHEKVLVYITPHSQFQLWTSQIFYAIGSLNHADHTC